LAGGYFEFSAAERQKRNSYHLPFCRRRFFKLSH